MKLLALALLALAATCHAQMQDPLGTEFLNVKDRYLGLMPAELVCAPHIFETKWSPSGKYLLLTQADLQLNKRDMANYFANPQTIPAPTKVRLLLWNSTTRRARELATLPPFGTGSAHITWFPGTDNAMVLREETRAKTETSPAFSKYEILRLDGANGYLSRLHSFELPGQDDALFHPEMSPTLPLAVLGAYYRGTGGQLVKSLYLVSPNGIKSVTVPPGDAYAFFWNAAGEPVVGIRKGAEIAEYHRLDPATGEAQSVPASFEHFPGEKPREVFVVQSKAALNLGARTVPADALILEHNLEDKESAVVGVGATGGQLSPSGEDVVYLHAGAAFIRSVFSVEKAVFDKAVADRERAQTVSMAHQAGTALMMYAADHGDDLPPGSLPNAIGPYFKNDFVLNRFVYTFAGGNLKNLKEPAKVELGYIPGAGGKAVCYADGHTMWVPDAK